MKSLTVETSDKTETIDITSKIEQKLDTEEGLINIFTQHTTTGLTVNEKEERLLQDINNFLNEVVPDQEYLHNKIDNNAESHLQQTLLNSELTLPVKDGEIQLGTWQKILLIELDGPRTRKIKLTEIPKK